MKLLAVDTSSPAATAAVIGDNHILASYTVQNGNTHSRYIMPMIADMLEKCGESVGSMDAFAVALGPGSFTGLRIGIATVKGFALAANKPVVGISSLECAANNLFFAENVLVCPIFDARHGNVYNAVFENGVRRCDDRLIAMEALLAELSGQRTIFVGDGVPAYAVQIQAVMGQQAVLAPQYRQNQRADALAQLAYQRALDGKFTDIGALSAIYLRPSQAEREYASRH